MRNHKLLQKNSKLHNLQKDQILITQADKMKLGSKTVLNYSHYKLATKLSDDEFCVVKGSFENLRNGLGKNFKYNNAN